MVGISAGKSSLDLNTHCTPTNHGVNAKSTDSTSAQASFADSNNLPYPVLSDSKDTTRKAYKVSKDFFGLAPGRETFFIDAKGIVRGVCESALSGA